MEDPNRKDFEDAIREANPAQFPDFTKINDELKQRAQANVQHTWLQRGPFLFCNSCGHEHSQWIGSDKKLTGYDERGMPIVKTVI